MRLALAQLDPTVGDLAGNTSRVRAAIAAARAAGAQVVAFPELMISGYPPEDLVLKDHFLHDCAEAVASLTVAADGILAVVGVPLDQGEGRISNAAAVLSGGHVAAVYHKLLLPNYAVFDEDRYFHPGSRVLVLQCPEARIGLNICEDIWYPCGPTEEAALLGRADLILNISMSPYHAGKGREREEMLCRRARDAGAYVVYVNGVGGQDELIFDGHSVVFGPEGDLLVRGPQFQEALLLVDVDPLAARDVRGKGTSPHSWPVEVVEVDPAAPAAGSPRVAAGAVPSPAATTEPVIPEAETAHIVPLLSPEAEVYRALMLGVRDYVEKNDFRHVVLGLSGGIDSALTACVAVDALGCGRVNAVTMPSRYSSAGTRFDAEITAANLGIELLELSIESVFAAYLDTLTPAFAGRSPDAAEENLQARIRGNLLMALSNKFGWLVLTTGNKSEMAVGYATLYGDMAGGFAVIKDVPKTLVYRLADYRNGLQPRPGPIPASTIERPPSAELRPDQTDQDSLPPYDLLDRIIQAYVVEDQSVQQIVAAGIPRVEVERVVTMIDRNEYKRRQAAPGIRITPKAFGKDRRLPITNRYRG
ncbi:MAG: NAD+ synthase [Thermoleophilia bacterium]|nr:NAD+ synthase [Thermoleophilia bacterium]